MAPWLFTVCRNRALDLRRRDGKTSPLPEDLALSAAAEQQQTVENAQLLGFALAELAQMTAKRREVLLLKFGGELSYAEIAEVTGLSVSHVGVILHEALSLLRDRMRRRGLVEDERGCVNTQTVRRAR